MLLSHVPKQREKHLFSAHAGINNARPTDDALVAALKGSKYLRGELLDAPCDLHGSCVEQAAAGVVLQGGKGPQGVGYLLPAGGSMETNQ